tara:strand:+ start:286 stop:1968 length:1683 start_codon:yes stop_codon:yes gene_type:complete
MLILDHLLIFSQTLLICLFLALNGFLFKRIILNFNDNKNFEENSLFGFILISFIALFINFFFPLSLHVNNIIFLTLVFLGLKFGYFNQNKKDLIKKCIYVSSLSYILFVYSSVNTPDALLYHLPYSKLINEHKIVIGASNIHFRFGHISIFQYISSFFNNSLLGKNGVLIPVAILVSNFLFYCLKLFINDFKKNLSRIKSYFVFLILIISLYSFSRYSGYGNDAQAHIYYFLTIIYIFEFFLIKKTLLNFQKILILTVFLFLLKPFFIICTLIPILIFFTYKKKYKIFKSKSFIFFLSFFFLWLLKTFLTTGCLIYPLKFTCNNNVFWSDDNVKNVSLEGEAWAKGWPQNTDKNLNQDKFVKNFNWIDSWTNIHFKVVIEKLTPVIIFIFLNYLFFYFAKCLKRNYQNKNHFFFISLFFLNILFVIIWFLKIPLYRQGFSFIYVLILFSFYFIFIKNIDIKKIKKFYNLFIICIVLSFGFFITKNIIKIINNTGQSITPIIHVTSKTNKSLKVFNKDNEFTHYMLANGIVCGFSKSPCTHSSIEVKKKIFYGYLIYYNFK